MQYPSLDGSEDIEITFASRNKLTRTPAPGAHADGLGGVDFGPLPGARARDPPRAHAERRTLNKSPPSGRKPSKQATGAAGETSRAAKKAAGAPQTKPPDGAPAARSAKPPRGVGGAKPDAVGAERGANADATAGRRPEPAGGTTGAEPAPAAPTSETDGGPQ